MEDKLIKALSTRGRHMFIAGRFRVEYDLNSAQGREINIRQNSHFDRSDLELLCKLVELGRVQRGPLITRVVKLPEASKVYETLRDTPGKLMRTVFDWRE